MRVPDAPRLSAEEQAAWNGGSNDPDGEVVEIEGTWNGCLDAHVCWGDLEREKGLDACLDRCYYNHDKVDGWKCRKFKNDKKREECWKDAVKEQSRCQVDDCRRDRPIITTTGGME